MMRSDEYINISNWLISSGKKHPIIVAVKNILLDYWHDEDCAIQYYMFHEIFKLVCDKYPEIWKKVPVYSNSPPHLLQYQLANGYSDEQIRETMKQYPIHKLTYKLPDDDLLKKQYDRLFM